MGQHVQPRGARVENDNDRLPSAGEARQVVFTMRRAIALLDDSADMLERLGRLGRDDVTADFHRHAAAIRAIRRQVAGPPREP